MPYFTAELKRFWQTVVTVLLFIMPLDAVIVSAHTAEPLSGEVTTSKGISLEERLGYKIPLGLTFRDEYGKSVRLTELITAPSIILPVYYSCSNVCNFLQGGLAKALPDVNFKPGSDYRVLSISFDETETPELALKYKKTYLSSMNKPFPEDGWRFLTGDRDNIIKLTDAAGYHFERKEHEFVHPVVSIVVARDGTIVRYLYGTNFLSKDLSLAILEAREGKIGETVKRIVGYCFSFDPEKKSYVFNLLRVSATAVILTSGGFLAFLVLWGKKRDKGKTG
ncbi:SCO family protein [Citrifermentans pelophilum]|uniref:SCO family protein n=1 Tax=Geoanaerobacter pelophilus TaxID=60036 RepID=UPI001FE431B1|nr:SCO family protein [Geoanaerobacter pelophilus]